VRRRQLEGREHFILNSSNYRKRIIKKRCKEEGRNSRYIKKKKKGGLNRRYEVKLLWMEQGKKNVFFEEG